MLNLNCPNCQKSMGFINNFNNINRKEVTCPHCQATVNKKFNIVKGLLAALGCLIVATVILFFVLGEGNTTMYLGGFAGILGFIAFGTSYNKKPNS
ncbi:hypothetical protein ACWA5Z_08075 [Testudinibacter sp. P80/BLE/0925]|uniref:hypothetical protein n=1 Tax=Testudinibacter sp. TW-1 TaxID=3417757 RepID=UPI003D36D5A9